MTATTKTTTLYGQAEDKITLEDALKKLTQLQGKGTPPILSGAVGLFYSPERCCFGQLQPDGTVTWYEKRIGWQSNNLNWGTVFEARVFNTHAELRWLKTKGNFGKAVLLSETKLESYFQNEKTIEELYPLNQTYLLWGEGVTSETNLTDGWSVLATARIGALPVPEAGVTAGDHVLLISREYLGVVDEDNGNMAVREERLIKLWGRNKHG